MARWRRRGVRRVAGRAWRAGRDRLVRLGVTPGQRSYRRFVVLARYRTGSNYLATLLGSHPNVVAFSEPFARPGIFWGNGVYGLPPRPRLRELRERDPRLFLREAVYRRYPSFVRAVGMKVFYEHLAKGRHGGLKDLLEADRDLRVIRLTRRNLLKVLVSTRVAKETGVMTAGSRREVERSARVAGPIRLEVDECRRFFEQMRAWERAFGDWCGDHPRLDVVYEELVRDSEREGERLLGFLDLPRRRLVSPLLRQSRGPLTTRVANYADLERAFAGTEWAAFFDGS